MWKLGPTADRAYVEVNDAEYPVRKVRKDGGDPTCTKFEDFVCRMSTEAAIPEVYVVDKVVNVRIKEGEVEYKVRWQGYGDTAGKMIPGSPLITFCSMARKKQLPSSM